MECSLWQTLLMDARPQSLDGICNAALLPVIVGRWSAHLLVLGAQTSKPCSPSLERALTRAKPQHQQVRHLLALIQRNLPLLHSADASSMHASHMNPIILGHS